MATEKPGRRERNRRPAPPRARASSTDATAAPQKAPSVLRAAFEAAIPGMLLAAMLLLPFAGKAFTIDDTLFLRQAEYVLGDPLHPSSLAMVWSEVPRMMRLSQVMPTGPLMAWLLVPAALSGGSEVVAHLLILGLLFVAIVEVAVLALRLGYDADIARLSALLLASTPTVLAMSGTVMPDIAAMTFGLVGIERLMAWGQTGSSIAGLSAAIALALAPLARGHLLLLVGLAPFVLGGAPRPADWRRWLPVVAAPLVMFALIQITRDPLGGSADVVRSAGLFSSLANLRSNGIAFGVHWVLLLPLGIAWMASRGRSFWASPFPWLGIAMTGALLAWSDRKWLGIAPVAGLGIAVIADVLWEAARRRDQQSAVLAVWLVLAMPVLIYLHFPSKYLTACAPAAAIIAASAVLALPRSRALALAAVLVAGGSLMGMLILSADESFANLGRRAVDELVTPHVKAGERVWFNANWGFQWYAEKAGATILTAGGPRPAPGDYVVNAAVTITGVQIQSFPKRELVATVSDSSPGARIISPELGAGFYSNGWGYLPWAWGTTEIDRFDLWRIR